MEPGSLGAAGTFLDVSVGPFELGLSAGSVLAVRHEVPRAAALELRGRKMPLVDLHERFLGQARDLIPFVVAFEAEGRSAAVGVDRVGHLGRDPAAVLGAVPRFGLVSPQLFVGALRTGGRVVLLLSPAGLVELASRTSAG